MPWGLAAAAAASVVGAVISSKSSSDQTDKQIQNVNDNRFDHTGLYDADRFNYGGYANGAIDASTAYNGLAGATESRAAPTTDYTAANSYAQAGIRDMSDQRQAAGLLSARANGSMPLVSQMQADRQMQQNIAAQASQAASARGAAGLALASQSAATNVANGSAAISGQAQINGAQEQMQNAQAAGQAYAGLRSGDLASQQQSANQAQYLSGLAYQQGQQNDQAALAYRQMASGVQQQQLAANIQQQNVMAGSAQNAGNLAYQAQAQNAANQRQAIGGAVQGISNAASSAAARAEGGPVQPGQPYLVGEKGPELIMPQQAGLVVPVGPTAQATGNMSGLAAAMQDPQKAQIIQAARQDPRIGLHLRQQAQQDPAAAAKINADPALHAIAMGQV